MKKLMTVIAAVAMSFGLFADGAAPKFITSFDGTDDGVVEGVFTPANPWSGITTGMKVGAWAGEKTSPYAAEGANVRRSEFATRADNVNFLPLETGKDTLTLAVGDVFVDQAVKFTGFEEEQTFDTASADCPKIAVWMSAVESEGTEGEDGYDEGETNLYVSCASAQGYLKAKLDFNAVPDQWYRLTIKSLGNIMKDGTRGGFLIYINGTQVSSADARFAFSAEDLDPKFGKFVSEGKLFAAMTTDNATFASIGYQGIGGIDDIIVDTDGPEFCQFVDGTVAPILGATLVLTADDEEVPVNEDGTFQAAPGSALVFTYTATEGNFLTGGKTTATRTGNIDEKKNYNFNEGEDKIESKLAVASYVDEAGDDSFAASIQDALDETLGGVKLLIDTTVSAPIIVPAEFTDTIDLNGKTVTYTANEKWAFRFGDDDECEAEIANGTIVSSYYGVRANQAVLTLTNVKITAAMRALQATAGADVTVDANCVLTTAGNDPAVWVESSDMDIAGTVQNTYDQWPASDADRYAYAISGSGNDSTIGVNLTIADDAVVSSANMTAIYFPCKGVLEIGAAEITGTEGVYVKAGATAIVDGATINGTLTSDKVEAYAAQGDGFKNTGDAFVVDYCAYPAGEPTVEITGGTFESAAGVAVASYAKTGFDRVTGFITGGLFKGVELPETDLIAAEEGQQGKWVEDESNPGYYKPTTVAVYDITITKPENGTLETSVTNGVEAGTVVTITATPAKDYELESITVDDVALEKGVYTFTMPVKGVTVTATFKATSTDPIDDPTGLDEKGEANLEALKKALPPGANINTWAATVYADGKIPALKLNNSTPELIAAAAKYDLAVMADPVEVKVEATETANCFKFTLSDADKANPLVAATKIQMLVQYTTALGEATPFTQSNDKAVAVALDNETVPTCFTATLTGKDTAGEASAAGFMKVEVK